MRISRTLRYHWLKFKRLQGDPKKLAWGMALGVFIGITPTVPFHTVAALSLPPLLRVSPVTTLLGIWVMNPLTMGPIYLAAFKAGQLLLFQGGELNFPDTLTWHSAMDLLWRGGLALQVGGLILAVPAAMITYFLTLWAIKRYRRRKAQKAASVFHLPENPPAASGPEA
jgi:uncharacterized protein (DUF2062 family)